MSTIEPVSKIELTMEEQEKELMYWESQYNIWFDKIEEKNRKIRKHNFFKAILKFKALPQPPTQPIASQIKNKK